MAGNRSDTLLPGLRCMDVRLPRFRREPGLRDGPGHAIPQRVSAGFRGSSGTCRRPQGQAGGRVVILHGHNHGRGASAAIPRQEVAHPELRHGRVHLRSGGERQDSERGQ